MLLIHLSTAGTDIDALLLTTARRAGLHNTGSQGNNAASDDTMVFDKQ
jgi:hypothetical protein